MLLISGDRSTGILFNFEDYLQLVDTTGRVIRDGKRGAISEKTPPILERLNISSKQWLENSIQFEEIYQRKFARRRRPKDIPLTDTG